MDDYISREAVFELIDNAPIIAGNENESLISASDLSDNIYCIPAADVVEVVRCKDCIHAPLPGDCEGNDMEWPEIDGIYEDCTCPHYCGDNWYSARPDPEGFCEKGERRESNLDTTKGERRDESSG